MCIFRLFLSDKKFPQIQNEMLSNIVIFNLSTNHSELRKSHQILGDLDELGEGNL